MTPQVQTLLNHLQNHGSISQAEAGTVYKIRALPRRIADLKAEGYEINRELKTDPTGQRYARYYYVGKKEVPVTPKIGDRVEVVNPQNSFGDYEKGSVGTVEGFWLGDENDLEVVFDHDDSKVAHLVFAHEVKVIPNGN